MGHRWVASPAARSPLGRPRALSAALALVLAAGCYHVAAPVGATDTAGSLEGPVWSLTSLRGVDPEALAALAEGVTIRFDQGRVLGFSGCNRLAGSYSVDGDRVSFGPLAATMMACGETATAVESAFRKALDGPLRFRVDAGTLTLADATTAESALVFAVAPPPRLEGVTWDVTGYNNGRQAVVSPRVGTVLTVAFEDGAVVGDAGCNTFRAPYSRDGDRLAIGVPATTRKQCSDDVMAEERQFLAALQSAATWTIDNGMLDVHRADGERVLHARARKP